MGQNQSVEGKRCSCFGLLDCAREKSKRKIECDHEKKVEIFPLLSPKALTSTGRIDYFREKKRSPRNINERKLAKLDRQVTRMRSELDDIFYERRLLGDKYQLDIEEELSIHVQVDESFNNALQEDQYNEDDALDDNLEVLERPLVILHNEVARMEPVLSFQSEFLKNLRELTYVQQI